MARPRVLLLAVKLSGAPMAQAFAAGGFDVAALGRVTSPLVLVCARDRRFPLRSANHFDRMFADLSNAIERFQPALIVPTEDRAAWFIRRCAERAKGVIRETLIRSFGRLETMDARLFKDRTTALAASLGFAVPRSLSLGRLADLAPVGHTLGVPLVLKRSHGSDGDGVRICVDRRQIKQAYADLTRGSSVARAMLRRLGGRDWWPTRSAMRAEAYIDGAPAMSAALALDGRALAILTAIAVKTDGETGHATVVRLVRHDGMAAITAAMIEAFAASGFISFDFMLDRAGVAHLIECNPRPIRVMRWGHLAGVDLIATLRAALAGEMPSTARLNDDGERTVVMEE